MERLEEPPFWRVLGDDQRPIAHIESYLVDFWACGNSEASCRSYAFDLLSWHRHLLLEQVAWDRATRDTVRDFVLSCRQPSALAPRVLSARTINHNLAVVSAYYAFHIAHQRGPLITPSSLDSPSPQGRAAPGPVSSSRSCSATTHSDPARGSSIATAASDSLGSSRGRSGSSMTNARPMGTAL